jgi:hypothetical protein
VFSGFDARPPKEWHAAPEGNKATSTVRYSWGTSALGNSDLSGVGTGEASVEVFASPGDRLAAEAQDAFDSIYGGCPAPEYVNRNTS